MRDHDCCEDAINAALAAGKNGKAEFLATRCDQRHGVIEPDPRAEAAREALRKEPA